MNTATNPGGVAQGSSGSGSLSLDQGADAIATLDDAPRDQRGRFQTRGQGENQPQDSEWDGDDEDFEQDGDDEFTDDADLEDVDEDAADDDEHEDSDEEQSREQKFKVRVDGEEQEVTASELIAGYQRGADYTRKTQALAEDRRRVDAVGRQAMAERGAYTQLLGQVAAYLESQAPAEDLVNRLMLEDPVEGFRAKTVRDGILGKAKEFADGYAAMVQGAQRQLALERADEMREAVKRLPELIPEWGKDAQIMQRERAAIGEAMVRDWGFTAEELDEITDPRAMAIARKAMLWDQLQAKKKAGKLTPTPRPGPKPMRPGSKQGNGPAARMPQRSGDRVQRMTESARKSGSIEAIAGLILETEFTKPKSTQRR